MSLLLAAAIPASAAEPLTYSLDKVELIPPKITARGPNERVETVLLTPEHIIIKLIRGKAVAQFDLRITPFPKKLKGFVLQKFSVSGKVSLLEKGGWLPGAPELTSRASGSLKDWHAHFPLDVAEFGLERGSECEYSMEGEEDGHAELLIKWGPIDYAEPGPLWEGGIRWTFKAGAPEPDEKLPVIFIPGVCGSVIKADTTYGSQLWPLKFNPLADRRDLEMDATGTKSKVPMVASDVIRSALGNDFYGSLIDAMESWGYEEGDNFAVFPYDWRQSNVRQIVALDDLITKVLSRTGKKKVIFLTHSMGGLVARCYLTLKGTAKVSKQIAVSMPNLGSPKVYFAYLMGYTFGNDSVNANLLKFLFPNWAAGYQIMPWRPFVQEGPLGREWSLREALAVSYRSVTHTSTNIFSEDSWAVSENFPWKFNAALCEQARDFQGGLGTQALVPTHSIIGYGLATISRYETLEAKRIGRTGAVQTPSGSALLMIPRYMTGDETVPLWSLEALQRDIKYYLRDSEGSSGEHTYIIQSQRAQRIIKGILDGDVKGPADLPDLDLKGPSEEERKPSGKGPAGLTIWCKADLHVYDDGGRHLGPKDKGSPEMKIPGSSFFKGTDDQYAAILIPEGAHRVKIVATGDGPVTLDVSLGSGPFMRTVRYEDVPMTKGAVAETEFSSFEQEVTKPSPLRVTADGKTSAYPGKVLSESAPPRAEQEEKPTAGGSGGKTETARSPFGKPLGSTSAGWTSTLAFHQLTTFGKQDALEVYNGQEPRLSDSGNRIVFSCRPAPDDPKGRSRVGVINFDGSSMEFVDTTTSPPMLDISGDGTVIGSVDGNELRITKEGESPRTLLEARGLTGIRLSEDGKRVFFVMSSDYVFPGTSNRLQRGIYVSGIDGSSMRKIAGASEVAPILGVPVESVSSFYSISRGAAMDASGTGRVVFLANARTPGGRGHVFTAEADGSNLRRAVGPVGDVHSVGISHDGSTIGWVTTQSGVEGYQGWIAKYDGSSPRMLCDRADAGRSVSLSSDGSQAVFGWDSKLYSADGSEPLPLFCQGASPFSHRFAERRLTSLVMSADGRRFLYAMNDTASYQLSVIELDPLEERGAPIISEVSLQMPSGEPAKLRLTARLGAQADLLGARMYLQAFKEGKELYPMATSALLCDDGKTNGDATASDRIFTDATIALDKSVLLPFKLRIRAELIDKDGKHHALVIEVRTPGPSSGG